MNRCLFPVKLIFFFATCIINESFAQKLPNKQASSLRAPSTVKIDGKADEWNNSYQSYNKATDLYYSISNNQENLYLIIKSDRYDTSCKILRGGISFQINPLSKDEKKSSSITYPSLSKSTQSSVTNLFTKLYNQKRKGDNVTVDEINRLLERESKDINVSGMSNIDAGTISIYNLENIKAVSKFGSQLEYIYELAIPLRYLNDVKEGSFNYHLKVNAEPEGQFTHGSGPPLPPIPMTATATTDFWGRYVLAKN